MYIAVCDDQIEELEKVMGLLQAWQTDRRAAVRLRSFRSAGELLDAAQRERFTLYLLDVLMPGVTGMEAAREIRSFDDAADIVFLTTSPGFAYESYGVRALEYLLKPISVRELEDYLERTVVRELGGTVRQAKSADAQLDPVANRPYKHFSNITNKMILIVKNDYGSNLSLTSISEKFNMSSKYIGRVVLNDTGLKFSEYLMVFRLQTARYLVENTREKISFIISTVGYSQQNNVYVHFKRLFGVSPGDLRRIRGIDEPEPDAPEAAV